MREICESELMIPMSSCDAAGRLSVHDTFGMFMDAAAVHAQELGVGIQDLLRRDLFWLTVKTRVVFHERPGRGETVTLRTWPEPPGHIRANRSYELRRGEKLLISGKTEWAVMNTKTGAVVPMEGVYPVRIAFPEQSACPEAFARIAGGMEGEPPYDEYRVRSTDIDIGGHMNNTAYVRMLMGSFTGAELRAMHIRSVDVVFREPCYEQDRLLLRRRQTDNGLDITAARGDRTVLMVHIEKG